MPPPPEADAGPVTGTGPAALVRLVRDEGPRVLATLVRTTGSLSLAEDALQDAVLRALEVWTRDGVPPQPRAWLTLTARRRAIDVLRREALRTGKEREAIALRDAEAEAALPTPEVIRDDLLRLLFTCCHPALAVPTQTALALRTLCGLSTPEVARALLVSEATMAKRLTRARQKIAAAGIPYRVPDAGELPERLRGVLATVYLLFNEGYSATGGDDPIRAALADEALRLARLLHELLPEDAGALGLLSLVLLQDARRPARLDGAGEPVLLAEQDRSRWDGTAIREGLTLLGQALRRTPVAPDSYVVQAAIAACHDLAPTWRATDWAAIVSWYDVLVAVADTPVTRLNRAVAVAELRGPAAGLAEMHAIVGLDEYPLLPAARAELLARLGRHHEALGAYDAALALPANAALRRHLTRRRGLLAAGR